MPQMSSVNDMEKARAAFLPHSNPYGNYYSASNEMAKLSEMAASSQANLMNGMNMNPALYSSQFYHNSSPMSAYLHPGMQAAAVAACSGQTMGGNTATMNMKYDDSLRRPVPYVFPTQYQCLRDWE